MRTIADGHAARAGRKVLLICDGAAESTRFAEGPQENSPEWQVYSRLIDTVLARDDLDIVLHLRSGTRDLRDAIAEWASRPPDRVRVAMGVPLSSLLPQTDLLVSFASAALIEGGASGLKPVQIGRFLTGSAGFSHVFADLAAFAAALQAGAIAGSMSLTEYGLFDAFYQELAGQDRLLERDPVILACRPAKSGRSFPGQTIVSALANPIAALRLLRASLHSRPTVSPGRPASTAGNRSVPTLVAGSSNEQAS